MPNKDGTGPQGKGPLTGRGLGDCPKNKSSLDSIKIGPGRSFGRGFGVGCGRRQRRFQNQDPGRNLED